MKTIVRSTMAVRGISSSNDSPVLRPWGSYEIIFRDDGLQVKRLIVYPGSRRSRQLHAQRSEHWTVVRGTARITLDNKECDLTANESTDILVGAVHHIANLNDDPVHIDDSASN